MLDAALAYARNGLPVIPLHSVLDDGSCTCGAQPGRCSPGKHPRIDDWRAQATTDETTIKKWWSRRRWPNASIGGVCGTFLCLDVDPRHGGFETLERLIASNTELPIGAVAQTGEHNGERGKHYWYRVPDDHHPATRANVREGIDIRGLGGYAVLPPSQHPSGVLYEWEVGSIEEAVEAPDWVLELTKEYVEGDSTWTPDPNFRMSKQVKQFLTGELEVQIGEQREFLTAAARSVLTTGRSVETTAALLWEGYDGNGGISNCEYHEDQPWSPEDVYSIVSDIYAKPPTSPLEKDFTSDEFSFDDMGNAARLIASFDKGWIFHVPELNRWYVWNAEEGSFFEDRGSWMRLRWASIAAELGRQAANARDEGHMKALLNHARNSRMRPRVEAAISFAEDHVAKPQHALNADPFLLGVANGVIDLRDGELRQETPSDLLTRHSPVEFDPDARSDLFDQFLERAVPDTDLRAFLQLACGYTLTGSVDEHAFFYVYGRPASGKTTMLEAFKHVMGSYAVTADTSTFLREGQRSGGGPTGDLARLAGARLVLTHEVEQGERMSVGLVSKIVGGDSITARFMYSPQFEFHPRFKLWIGANHLPRVVGGIRSGIWRRVKVISFDEPVPKSERDPTLPLKLREPEAAQAILAWAIEGAVLWHDLHAKGEAIPEPARVEEEVAAYKRESDHVNAFAEEALERSDLSSARVPVGDLFKRYQQWCDTEGRDRRETQHALARKLKDLGFEAKTARHDGTIQRCWINVQLREHPSAGINVKGARKRGKRRRSSS
jgi:putative DNA primase/helicase